MNYDEARMLAPDTDAPGRWNWTTMNDGVIRTAAPCHYPDFDWDAVASDEVLAPGFHPTGRPRCDHLTREEAERHYWRHELDTTKIEPVDLDAIHERRRCDYPGCKEWEEYRTRVKGWGYGDSLCERHANRVSLEEIHPFILGTRVIHS